MIGTLPVVPSQSHSDRQAERQQQHGDARDGNRPFEGFAGENDRVLNPVGQCDVPYGPLSNSMFFDPPPRRRQNILRRPSETGPAGVVVHRGSPHTEAARQQYSFHNADMGMPLPVAQSSGDVQANTAIERAPPAGGLFIGAQHFGCASLSELGRAATEREFDEHGHEQSVRRCFS